MTTLSPELAALKEAGEALTRIGQPVGPIIDAWFAADCRGSLETLLGLSGDAARGKSRTRAMRLYWRDECLRQAARLLPAGADLPYRLRKAYQVYGREVWPSVETEEHPPSDHSEIERLFFQAMKKWPHEVGKTIDMREILGG